MPDSLFEGFIDFNRRVMRGLDEHEAQAVRYRWLLGQINDLLTRTHEMVVEELDRIEDATSLEEARAAVDRLRGEPLSESFHAEGLCDAFVGLGDALSGVNDRTRTHLAAEPGPTPDFGEHLDESETFAQVLSNRENVVAMEYGYQIGALRELLFGQASDDLGAVKALAADAKRVLTDQLSDFQALAAQFKGVGAT